MAQALDKRTADDRVFDLDCTDLLPTGVTITSVTSIACEPAGLTFGSPAINAAPVTYKDGRTAAAGKVIQVRIGGGSIPSGKPSRMYTLRALFATSAEPAVEATVLLRLIDTPNVY